MVFMPENVTFANVHMPSTKLKEEDPLDGPQTWDDATWILTSAFIIFTMQSGFGLLEAGCVSGKNEVNILVKNAMDVIFGGVSYWIVGYGFSFGEDKGTNPFIGIGNFFVDSLEKDMGFLFSTYIFQLSFATTATTIVSGCMAERTKLSSYIIFSFFNTFCYVPAAHWVWASDGFLGAMGVIDFAGSGVVHLLGGVSGICAALILGPRTGRFDPDKEPPQGSNPVNALLGMFILWWGWVGFNCGSTFGIAGVKWKLAAKTAATTFCAACAGGAAGVLISYVKNRGKKYDISDVINALLGALVGITAPCAVISTLWANVVGIVSAFLAIFSVPVIEWVKIDDPVGAIAVHGVCGFWGLLAVGLFAELDVLADTTKGRNGLFAGGGFYLLGVQTLAALIICVWAFISTWIILFPIHKLMGIRLNETEEFLGADLVEHDITFTENELEQIAIKIRKINARKEALVGKNGKQPLRPFLRQSKEQQNVAVVESLH